MTKDDLYTELSYVNHSREKRLQYANLVYSQPKLITPLLEILFSVDDKTSCRAAWVFEFACSKDITTVIPYLDVFTKHMATVHLDSAVRPVAKIGELITKAYYGKEDSEIKSKLNTEHKERIVAACFDWVINDEKVAVKAYSMHSLFLLGKEFDWIYPELRLILERDFSSQSAAFKARAKQILKKIKT